MLKLMRLGEIHKLPVGSDIWKKAIYKYALITLSNEQENELRTTGTLNMTINIGQCSDYKSYICNIKLCSDNSSQVTYKEYGY